MRLQSFVGVLSLVRLSAAFSDSTPWVLISTAAFEGDKEPSQNPVQASSQVLSSTRDILSSCPTERYLLVSQPNLNAADLSGSTGCSLPHLCQVVDDPKVQGKYIVPEVIGSVETSGLSEYIKSVCSDRGISVKVDELALKPLTSKGLSQTLDANDEILDQSLDAVTSGGSYTIILLSAPAEVETYEPEFDETVGMELKRDASDIHIERQDNETDPRKLPLFEKYQFLSPGIFMGIIVAIILFSILGVGLRALTSLEVSYGAFEKDMGPAAQKKQQ